jgi:hypothetical protein
MPARCRVSWLRDGQHCHNRKALTMLCEADPIIVLLDSIAHPQQPDEAHYKVLHGWSV